MCDSLDPGVAAFPSVCRDILVLRQAGANPHARLNTSLKRRRMDDDFLLPPLGPGSAVLVAIRV